jgi:cytidyltransferase-like protein
MITTYEKISDIRQEAAGQPIYFKGGVFDLLHVGHLSMLQFLRSLGGVSVVGVVPNGLVRSLKGPDRPINDELVRAEDVDSTGLADYVLVMPEGTWGVAKTLRSLRPEAYVMHQTDRHRRIFSAALKTVGIKPVVCNEPRICSTTGVLEGSVPASMVVSPYSAAS